jgi:hypothetical protein
MTNTKQKVVELVGDWYDNQPVTTDNVQPVYDRIVRINHHYFKQIPIEVVFQSDDPYDNFNDMKNTVERENKLRVFDGGSQPKHMSHKDNIIGRAVHDWFGHLEADCDFSMKGEFLKWYHVKNRYPSKAQRLMFTEIVGQRAMISKVGGFEYEQKAVLAPKSLINEVLNIYEV